MTPRHAAEIAFGVVTVAALSTGCGGRTQSGVATTAQPNASIPDGGTILIAVADGRACSEGGELPVIAHADELGRGCTFIGMAATALYAECGATRSIAVLRPGIAVTSNWHPIEGIVRPSLTLAGVSTNTALLCDEEDCRLFVLDGATYVPAAYPPAPAGPWHEIFAAAPADGGADASLGFVSLRSDSELATSSGGAWGVQSLGWPSPPAPAACLSEIAIRMTRGWRWTGLTSDGVVMDDEQGRCCVVAGPFAGATDVDAFQCGDMESLWVLTPSALWGTFDCGHD
jgi:hypothetical protein